MSGVSPVVIQARFSALFMQSENQSGIISDAHAWYMRVDQKDGTSSPHLDESHL